MTKRERELIKAQAEAIMSALETAGAVVAALSACMAEEEEECEQQAVCPSCSSSDVARVPGTDVSVCAGCNTNFRAEGVGQDG